MEGRDKDAAELAWKMFEKTGNVSYYMLYKRLNDHN
ncbi:MAG: YqzL family protein [Clostridia bacterium]|nr:YqzL family protein [Clostridia bacterium]